MSYPGYPSAPPQSQYAAPTQQFDRAPEAAAPAGPSKLPLYLGIAVVVFGFAIYLSGFGPVFGGIAGAAVPTFYFVIAPLLAGLLAGVSLLPKQDDKSAVAAVLAVLGFLLLILVVLADGPSIDWGFYPFIVFSVLQAIAAVAKLLLDAGIIAAPAPKPKYEQQAYGYGPPPQQGYYGQSPQGGHAPQQRPGGYAPQPQSQYGGGGYQREPSTGGFPALGQQGAPHNGPQSGPPTPPTGFPAFGSPQAQGSAPTVAQPSVPSDAEQPQQQAPQQSAPPPS
jgi:Family of unknown function (DUF5336)